MAMDATEPGLGAQRRVPITVRHGRALRAPVTVAGPSTLRAKAVGARPTGSAFQNRPRRSPTGSDDRRLSSGFDPVLEHDLGVLDRSTRRPRPEPAVGVDNRCTDARSHGHVTGLQSRLTRGVGIGRPTRSRLRHADRSREIATGPAPARARRHQTEWNPVCPNAIHGGLAPLRLQFRVAGMAIHEPRNAVGVGSQFGDPPAPSLDSSQALSRLRSRAREMALTSLRKPLARALQRRLTPAAGVWTLLMLVEVVSGP